MKTHNAVDWRAVGWYTAAVCLVAWTLEIGAMARSPGGVFAAPPSRLVMALAMWCPALCAFAVSRISVSREFPVGGWHIGSGRTIVWAWLGILAIFALAYLLTVTLGLATFDPRLSGAVDRITVLATQRGAPRPPIPGVVATTIFFQSATVGVLATALMTLGEELGWTGFLLPRLLPLGAWKAALIYGVIWGVWHWPLIVAGYNYPDHPAAGVIFMCGATCAIALIQTAVWLRTRSVIATSVTHAVFNAQGHGLWPLAFHVTSPLIGGMTGAIGITICAIAGAVALTRAVPPPRARAA
jgi:membrane protease YdiL (CAAX protease family)